MVLMLIVSSYSSNRVMGFMSTEVWMRVSVCMPEACLQAGAPIDPGSIYHSRRKLLKSVQDACWCWGSFCSSGRSLASLWNTLVYHTMGSADINIYYACTVLYREVNKWVHFAPIKPALTLEFVCEMIGRWLKFYNNKETGKKQC